MEHSEDLERLLEASECSRRSGDHAAGRDLAREAVEAARVLGARSLEARGLSLQAEHEFRLGENEASLASLHAAITLYTGLGDLRGVSAALNGMVMAYHELGLQEEALEHASSSLVVAKESGDQLTLAWAYNRAGLAHASVGHIAEGISSMEFALSLAREVDDEEAVFAALNNLIEDLNSLARTLFEEGADEAARARVARALELAPEALERGERSGSTHSTAIILLSWGDTLALAGEYDRAGEAIDKAEQIAGGNGYRPILLGARYSRARLEILRGRLEPAIAAYEALLADAEAARDALVLVDVHLSLYRAHKELGQYREALAHHERYHGLERRQQSEMAKTRARILSAHLELDRAQLEARRATLEAELERSRAQELVEETAELRREREVLFLRADQDGLTGLWNRRHIEHELPRLVREAGARAEPISVAFLDADKFKQVNDRFGHLVGDDVLRRLADVLRRHVRPSDVVARLGGEEFVVLLPGAGAEAAFALGQRLCDAVRELDWTRSVSHEIALTISVGVATVMPQPTTVREVDREVARLLERADGALYGAKRAGRDRVVAAE